jgi:putative MATE family efflux protein
MISRAVGSKDIPFASHVALQGFMVSAIYSILMVCLGFFLTDFFLRLIGASPEVQAETSLYMRIQFVGMALQGFRMSSASALQASGNVMTPLRATTVTRIIHITLTPFLMFGWWGFPTFGLAGAALANVLSQIAGFAINFQALIRGSSLLKIKLSTYRIDYRVILQLVRIGLPASVAATERTGAQLILLRFVTPFGDVALAAYTLTRRFEMFANFGSMGIGQSSGIMAGQNLGAGRPDRARQAVIWGLVYVTGIIGALAAILLIFPGVIISFFTNNPEVIALSIDWLRIVAIGFIFMSLGMVFQQSFNTAGDTIAPMIFTLIALWGIELPLAWLLAYSLDIGPLGFAYARVLAMVSRLFLYVPYFFWGRWLRVRVF